MGERVSRERLDEIRRGDGEPQGEYQRFLENDRKLHEMTPMAWEERVRRAFMAGSHSRVPEIQDLLHFIAQRFAEIDQALEDDCGGFYLSAPEGTPLAKVRAMVRGEGDE